MSYVTIAILFGLSITIPLSATPPAQMADGDDFTNVLTDHVLIYRGELWYRNALVEGPVDLEFRVFASDTDVAPMAPTILAEQWPVREGRVLVELDFGNPALFQEGAWLEVTVDGTILSPRHFIPPSGMTLFASDVSAERRAAASADESMLDEESSGNPPEDAADASSSGASFTPGGALLRSSSLSSQSLHNTVSGAKHSGGSSASSDPTRPNQSPDSPQGISPASGGDGWQSVGQNIVWTTRKVGIGMTNPAYKLDIRASSHESGDARAEHQRHRGRARCLRTIQEQARTWTRRPGERDIGPDHRCVGAEQELCGARRLWLRQFIYR